MKPDIMLTAHGLSFRPGGHAVLGNVCMNLVRGHVTALVGPTGAGKSALLGILSGHLAPCSGTVELDGHQISGLTPHVVNRLGIWRVGPAVPKPDVRTVRERIASAAQWHVRGHHVALAQADEVARRLGLEPHLHKAANCLAPAARRRLALACALAARPRLLLLDGLLEGLDARDRAAMASVIRGLCGDGVTVLMAERFAPAVSKLAHDVVVLASGTLVASGSADILRDPDIARACTGQGDAAAAQVPCKSPQHISRRRSPPYSCHTSAEPAATKPQYHRDTPVGPPAAGEITSSTELASSTRNDF
ncbi:ATP-binding cassette domain-containing protein [Cupriavidus numazuensis]|uniref:Vitamin B12 import ATP-binding protein BtuD n=1 Tax=Cupriavidus numazuensis TaxID=221992 RepID=A0ABM8TKA7_9BURK|nr:ATP-binding cassette domain-containing protein [Cupriavidus numazuensis]CAG2151706.1 Vitamin B12 import ATP-binding protein BtuD [Cupriavidus numazuensis]